MNIDYNYTKKNCIEWYINEGFKHSKNLPNQVQDNIQDNQDDIVPGKDTLDGKVKRSRFQRFDLATIANRKYPEDKGFIYFITAKSLKRNILGNEWNYSGMVLQVGGSELLYVAMEIMPQRRLKSLQ